MFGHLIQHCKPSQKFLLGLILSVFIISVLRYIELPGLYFDAVNPDYIAAKILHPHLPQAWSLRNLIIAAFPPHPYHGLQHIYLSLPFYYLFGTNIVSLRLFQALFGLGILYFGYHITQQLTRNHWFAFFAMLGLATEIAFIAAFRTQFYITMAGDFWLFAAIFLLTKPVADNPPLKRFLWAGIFIGLSIYSYFIFLFFLPALLLWVMQISPKPNQLKACIRWIIGIIIGLCPYTFNYISIFLKLQIMTAAQHHAAVIVSKSQNIAAANKLQAISTQAMSSVNKLQAIPHHLNLITNWKLGWQLVLLALTNAGNELLIFAKQNILFLEEPKVFALIILLGLGLIAGGFNKKNPQNTNCWFFILLPISFFIFAALFATRLWAHHYSVLLPFFYIELAIASFFMWQLAYTINFINIVKRSLIVIASLLILLNLVQQQCFFTYLNATGGVKKYSNALNLMAEEAIGAKENALYIFPEWGFMAPFVFLTHNRVAYDLNLDQQAKHALEQNKELRLCFWDFKDVNQYEASLQKLGAKNLKTIPYLQRNGDVAFYMIKASHSLYKK
ncbi:MAG: glycosyl transferase family protein [Gammaproteobacteria bacterium]|jgi:4-amino-4-deoxy-L-arabinose transferase-like glycosyltransferase|nr:glycosyl transferase family protein [Gammaproteobacteria bacterium]